ncbi:MAG TPA: hypothetical protein VG326_14610 [Tepidisphaeraceae bacterium]|jgi:hypothetical protein|nr:hypothetical protein [Tepidisphaeraceae bacterium]
MSCEVYRQFALDQNWDQDTRRRAAQTLQHLESCPECQRAVQDYDRLRQTLGSFAAQADPPAGWDRFTPPSRSPSHQSDRAALEPPISRFPSRWRVAWTGIAAALFLAASVAFEMGQASARPTSNIRAGASVLDHAFSPRDLPQREELSDFGQIRNSSNGLAGWMIAEKSTSEMGLSDGAHPPGRQALILRLALTNGPELTSSADLLIVPGQTANFKIPGHYGPDLRYRITTSAIDPSQFSLALDLTAPAVAEPLAALATSLRMQSGERLTAGRLVTAYGEYELNVSFAYARLPEVRQ